MNIPINDDFERNYKIEAWKGFDIREVAAIAAALLVSVALTVYLVYLIGLPLMISFYIGMVPALPVIVLAFWRSRLGKTLPEHLQALSCYRSTRKLIYRAGEYNRKKESR